MAGKARISADLTAFLESGLAIVVATRDGDLQPDGAGAWAARVGADRAHLTVFLHEAAAGEMLRNLGAHPEIAVDLDRPTTHRACQIKGLFESGRPARKAERALVDQQVEALAADLDAIGVPREMTAGWETWPCTAIRFRVTELYEQTPGPGTGEPLR